MKQDVFRSILLVSSLLGWVVLPGCFGGSDSTANTTTSPARVCESITGGTPWTPNVPGVSASNHDSSVEIFKSVQTASGVTLTGLDESFTMTGSKVATFTIDMSEDLLENGSLSLVAQTTGFELSTGSAWPVLVSLHDGVNELVALRGCDSGTGGQGFYQCTNGTCTTRSACAPDPDASTGSAFVGVTAADRRDHWEQHQSIGTSDYLSTNTFPTCNWTTGSPACSFTTSPGDFFGGTGKLRSGPGVTYTAKYVLLTSNYSSAGGYKGSMKLTVIRKKDGAVASGHQGAMDLNVVLVGSKNIRDSRTAKGKKNLDELFTHVVKHFNDENASSTGVKIGTIKVYEWTCEADGDAYATVDINDTGALFAVGSSMLGSATEGKALNIFLVSKIEYSGAGTILGLAGAIRGPMINGTTASGVVFSSFDKLATFNPSCSTSSCPISSQDSSFINMGSTISHELGHFLGLNHLSESGGTAHDFIADTPECTYKTGSYISIGSCRTHCNSVCSDFQYTNNPYCPSAPECQFNHVMWWTTKNYNSNGQGDGNLFSDSSGAIINYNPYVQ